MNKHYHKYNDYHTSALLQMYRCFCAQLSTTPAHSLLTLPTQLSQ